MPREAITRDPFPIRAACFMIYAASSVRSGRAESGSQPIPFPFAPDSFDLGILSPLDHQMHVDPPRPTFVILVADSAPIMTDLLPALLRLPPPTQEKKVQLVPVLRRHGFPVSAAALCQRPVVFFVHSKLDQDALPEVDVQHPSRLPHGAFFVSLLVPLSCSRLPRPPRCLRSAIPESRLLDHVPRSVCPLHPAPHPFAPLVSMFSVRKVPQRTRARAFFFRLLPRKEAAIAVAASFPEIRRA